MPLMKNLLLVLRVLLSRCHAWTACWFDATRDSVEGSHAPKRRMHGSVRPRNVRATSDVIAERHEDCGNADALNLR
jgi:hypothetical protein